MVGKRRQHRKAEFDTRTRITGGKYRSICRAVFRRQFREKLSKRKEIPSVQSARPQYWFNVSLGRSGIHLSNTANTFDNKIGVRVYIRSKVASAALPQLLQMKEEIETEIGEKLEWDPNPENQDKIISFNRDANLHGFISSALICVNIRH